MAEHFMLKELREGPEAVKKTLQFCEKLVEGIHDRIASLGVDKGFIIGSGTSFHASVATQYLVNKFTKYHFTAVPASEFEDWTPLVTNDYIIFGYSQSGESSDIIKAVKVAKTKGIFVIGITNTKDSTLTKVSDFSLVTQAGEEKAVVATKTYDAQLTAGSLLAYSLSKHERAQKLKELLLKDIASKLEDVLKREKEIKELAEKYKDVEHIYILGRGVNYANALEAGLKFKEAAMIHSEGFAVREFLHGPIQLVDEKTPVIVLLPTKTALEGSLKALEKLKGYNAPVIGIVGDEVKADEYVRETIVIPTVEDELSVLPVVKAIQILAYYLSVLRGLNPDKPTKLTKVVKYEKSK
ncbi:MAG TPA: SIS domain-containing protein [Thermoprotei archaeon]|nr:SIS domain-containing protein [Thermoprotei archaeon]